MNKDIEKTVRELMDEILAEEKKSMKKNLESSSGKKDLEKNKSDAYVVEAIVDLTKAKGNL